MHSSLNDLDETPGPAAPAPPLDGFGVPAGAQWGTPGASPGDYSAKKLISPRSFSLRVVAVPVLFIAVLQASGCSSRTAAPPPPGGTYISTSAGAHFDQAVTLAGDDVEEGEHIAQYPLGKAHRPEHTPQSIYIAAGTRGVVMSQDGGNTWRLITTPLTAVVDIVRLENGVFVVSGINNEGQGYIIRSIDEGKSWEVALTIPLTAEPGGFQILRVPGLPTSVVVSLEVDPFNPDQVYAGSSLGNVFVGEQSGKTWRALHTLKGDPLGIVDRASLGITDIVASPHTADEILILSANGSVRRLRDGQETDIEVAQDVNSTQPGTTFGNKRILDIHYIPSSPQALFAGVEDGAVISRDGGKSWSQLPLPLDQ
ncbi:MAG: sialidase family protein, partial [Candidatus Andersenbacteria bacterium]